MKNSTSKLYFYKNNSVNKGYQAVESTSQDHTIDASNQKFPFLDPVVLEVFESSHPGSMEKIIQMAEREQKHKHAYEISHLQSYARSRMFGQIISFIALLLISYVTMKMALEGNTNMAIILSTLYFVSVFSVSLFSYLRDKTNRHVIGANNIRPFKGKGRERSNIKKKVWKE